MIWHTLVSALQMLQRKYLKGAPIAFPFLTVPHLTGTFPNKAHIGELFLRPTDFLYYGDKKVTGHKKIFQYVHCMGKCQCGHALHSTRTPLGTHSIQHTFNPTHKPLNTHSTRHCCCCCCCCCCDCWMLVVVVVVLLLMLVLSLLLCCCCCRRCRC